LPKIRVSQNVKEFLLIGILFLLYLIVMKSQPFIIRDLFNQYSDIIFCTIWIESFYVRSYVYRQVLFYAKVTFLKKSCKSNTKSISWQP